MDNKTSFWNGLPVVGDVKELDYIVESNGFINLSKEDIIEVLSASGENYVVTGTGEKINDAFDNAVANLPCNLDSINNLLISFHCSKETNNDINDLVKISRTLSEANREASVKWGIANDNSLAETFKVVLVASKKV